MPPTTMLTLSGPTSRLDAITRDLAFALAEAQLDAHPADTSPSPGVDVDVAGAGQIALGPITSGGVTALVGCLKAAFEREPGLAATLRQPDGTSIALDPGTLDDAVRTLALAVSPPA